MRDVIKVKDLNFKYKKNVVFKNLTFNIKEGHFVVITGSNNSGKTTLIKLLSGFLPSNNKIVLSYSYITDKRIQDCASDIGVVLSNIENQFLFDTVYQELAFPLENLNYDPVIIEKRILEITSLFKLDTYLDKKIRDLTASEKQKLLIVLALLHNPKILLLDNPFSMMSKDETKFLIKVLKAIQKKKTLTIIVATNNLEIATYADYMLVLHEGALVIEGAPLAVMREEKLINRVGLKLPFMVDLSLKLNFYELIDEIELDMDKMVNKLWK